MTPGVAPGRGARPHRSERVRQVDPAGRSCSASSSPTPGRCGSATSISPRSIPTPGGPASPGSRSVRISSPPPSLTTSAWAGRTPAAAEVRARPWPHAGLAELVGPPARGPRHPARRGRRGAVGGRAPAGGAGPGLPARRPAPAPRRAHRQPRRRDRGRGARRGPAAWRGGRTVVLVAHRPALLALADRVVDLGRAEVDW